MTGVEAVDITTDWSTHKAADSTFCPAEIKDLLTRTESEIDVAHSAREISRILTLPESGPLLT